MVTSLSLLGLALYALNLMQIAYAITPQTETNKELLAALEYYLDADCGTEPKEKEARKKPFGPLRTLLHYKNDPALESRLLEILRIGLYPGDVDLARSSFGKEWEERQVKRGTSGRADAKRTHPDIEKNAYVNQQLQRRIKMYQQKAAVALVVLDTPKAKQALAQASKKDTELARTIEAAYARYGLTHGLGGIAGKVRPVPFKNH